MADSDVKEMEIITEQTQAVQTETKEHVKTEIPSREKEYEEEIQGLNTEVEKLRKRTENQQKFFDRIGTELGLLRKQLPEDEKRELEKVRDAFAEDPIKGMSAYKEYEGKIKEREDFINKVQVEEKAEQVKENLSNLVKDFETKIDEIAELLKEDGASADTIRQYKENPYVYGEEINLNLYKRTISRSEVKKLNSEVEKLRQENEELKKKSGEIFDNIEKASNSSTISSKTTTSNVVDTNLLKKDPWTMSRAELKQAKILLNRG
ncbi:MAG: hypothetical protein IT451_11865 [Candidatus Brocadia sp.]|nr:hypothetical protein [Candidatus Brocadia sp.]